MLQPFGIYNNVFVEITKSEHQHGGIGWEFGTCLWSPSRNSAGNDRYSLMRKPQESDLVLHFYDHVWNGKTSDIRLCGYSIVSSSYQEVVYSPPSPGKWANRTSYYRIDLRGFTFLDEPLPISTLIREYGADIRRDLIENKPRFYPFNTYRDTISTVQGIYLAQVTETLYNIFIIALGIQQASNSQNNTAKIIRESNSKINEIDLHYEYAEARRRANERYFFARNPKLAQQAKQVYGYQCQICNFDFEKIYGTLGHEYIEAHHLNPLSERAEKEWTAELCTNIIGVTVLCANCHRMIHRKRPALSTEELKQALQN